MMMMMYKDHIFFEASINIVHDIMKKLFSKMAVVWCLIVLIKRLCHNQ